ncbi:hypothetical protein [Roseovarius azorensis]|nr:hypothetical protein [Roseovarius azorensis]
MTQDDSTALTRRRALARLGLAAGLAYVAPVMMHLGAAHASGASGRGSGWSRGSRWSGPSGRGYYRSGYHGYYGSGPSHGGYYGSGPSGRHRDGRVSTGRVVNGILRTLDDLGVIR